MTDWLRPYDTTPTDILFDELKHAMWPFRPIQAEVYIRNDHIERILCVRIKNLPFFKFDYQLSDAERMLFDDWHRAAAGKISEYWHSIPRLEPESHILLGDN